MLGTKTKPEEIDVGRRGGTPEERLHPRELDLCGFRGDEELFVAGVIEVVAIARVLRHRVTEQVRHHLLAEAEPRVGQQRRRSEDRAAA